MNFKAKNRRKQILSIKNNNLYQNCHFKNFFVKNFYIKIPENKVPKVKAKENNFSGKMCFYTAKK